jgi:hypothetical protein
MCEPIKDNIPNNDELIPAPPPSEDEGMEEGQGDK